MRPTRIAGADPKPLAAPEDWVEEKNGHCGALFVKREVHDGVHYMRSAWEVEANEAGLLLAGAKMTLAVAGDRHPVVQLGIGPLPDDFETVLHARRFTSMGGTPCVRVEMIFAHGGGRRGYCEVAVGDSFASAVSDSIARIEQVARREGWIA